jgi:hypothetical protein
MVGDPPNRTAVVTRPSVACHLRCVSIDFFDLLGVDGWVTLAPDPLDAAHLWIDGRPLAEAPVDVGATFDGALWQSTKIDPSFNLQGLRSRPGFTVPRRHLNLRLLTIVIGGSLVVRDRRVGPGQFFVVGAGTPFSTSAGPEGATYLETWPEPAARLETYWHDADWVSR